MTFDGEPLEISVQYYAAQWERFDRAAWEDLRPTCNLGLQREAITRIVGMYRVARNLAKKRDVGIGFERYAPLLDAANATRASATAKSTAPQLVHRMFVMVKERYGVQAVSLCSKVLWFAMRSPIVIYDDNALTALRVQSGSYGTYLTEWRKQYERLYDAINKAICATSFERFTDDTRTHSTEEWFKERVFDIALWRAGDRLKKNLQ
jgi:hypothetical protein